MANVKANYSAKDLPKSCTSGTICYVGVLCFIFSLFYINKYEIENNLGAIISGLALIVPIIILEFIELKSFKNPSTGLDYSLRNKPDIKRVLIKLLGLYATLALVFLFYSVIPEYQSDYYMSFWYLAKYLLILILLGSIPYFFILDRFLVEPEESYWKVGMIVLGQWKKINFDGLKDHFLGWLVKSFFLPLMYIGLAMNVGYIKGNSFFAIFDSFDNFFNYTYVFIYTIDLVCVTVGYVMTLRIFDSHIRTVEPSFLGWYVAVQCYYPFWDSLEGKYFAYNNDGLNWGNWLVDYPNIYIIWGIMILSCVFIYSWSSVIFGIRFSNLTNRGILTNGPYRFMRHPAYISKNFSWWLIAIPFISEQGFFDAFKNCCMLLLVNYLYFLRAKTEERHLSKDPTYVQYATVMNHVGIFSFISKRIPFFRYNPDTNIEKTGKRRLF